MPLSPGGSKEVVSKNIRELYNANEGKADPRPRKQIIAIALENARRTGKSSFPRYRKEKQQ